MLRSEISVFSGWLYVPQRVQDGKEREFCAFDMVRSESSVFATWRTARVLCFQHGKEREFCAFNMVNMARSEGSVFSGWYLFSQTPDSEICVVSPQVFGCNCRLVYSMESKTEVSPRHVVSACSNQGLGACTLRLATVHFKRFHLTCTQWARLAAWCIALKAKQKFLLGILSLLA